MMYPTSLHEAAAAQAADFFARRAGVRAVLLVNSCARGTAVPESDVDLAILVDAPPESAAAVELGREWQAWSARQPAFREMEALGAFARMHVDLFDGRWMPQRWDDGGGPDAFEIEIGNRVAHSAALWDRGGELEALRSAWLPYYAEDLRAGRLAMVRASVQHNVHRLWFYAGRGLHFQAFDRLYHAFQEFLQALFISRRVYPIAYDKWIREQVEGWLGLPELYAELPRILEITNLEGDAVVANADHLLRLLDRWTSDDTKVEG